jgi:DNA polymerase (family X)
MSVSSAYNESMKLSKNMNNLEIAELLRAVAASLQLKNESKNKFRIIAYERAADAVEHASSELKDMWDEGKLTDVPGIGESIASHLDELFKTGTSKHFEAVMKGLPPAMFKLMELPGVGAKTAFKLVDKLNIKSLADLEKATKAGKVAELEGFGHKSEQEIALAVKETKGKIRRHLLPYAEELANNVIVWLKELPEVKKADPLGSLRRKVATVGDIDISVATNEPQKVMDHFNRYPKATRTIEKGERSSSILLPGNVQVDLMVTPPESYGSLLQHFTGSKHHNIALREYALKRGLSLSEYGIKAKDRVFKFSDEESFYRKLDLDFIPPELREDSGEIEAAKEGKIPDLVEVGDIKADLQIHSDFDIETSHDLGESTMKEIVEMGNKLGYSFLAMTEHNPSRSGHSESEIVDILKRKKEAIEKLNYSIVKTNSRGVRKVFNSLEIDIGNEGDLPVSDSGLELLDFALVSVHSSFRLTRDAQTNRILKALAHPKVKILAHPTARKLNEREGIEVNWPEVFAFCIENGKWLEIDADPMRLDLPDNLVHEAIKAGVKLSMGTDAHHAESMNNMPYGVTVARRGWAKRSDIVNCLSLQEFESMLDLSG